MPDQTDEVFWAKARQAASNISTEKQTVLVSALASMSIAQELREMNRLTRKQLGEDD